VDVSPKKSSVKFNQITPKNSPAKSDTFRTPTASPSNKKNIVTTPKSSSKLSSSLSPSPKKTVQLSIITQKLKSPSVSPLKLGLQNKTINSRLESPKKQLSFDDEISVIGKSGSKRKISPIKTPENKKIKRSSLDSPDTQVRNIIIYLNIVLFNLSF